MTDIHPRCQREHRDHPRGFQRRCLGVIVDDALTDGVAHLRAGRICGAGSALTVPAATVPVMPCSLALRPERHR